MMGAAATTSSAAGGVTMPSAPSGTFLRGETGALARVEHFGVAENLETLARRVVHEQEARAVIHREAANADHLPVAAVVGEHEFARAGDAEEALRGAVRAGHGFGS